ncbi:MAG: hypothetical protein A2041_01100 [Bacteroidetes bacterium GWA2_31_9b]|nr:MAG: hypothetical protein A2041_01100 [Bacteroidetes bacterium GWA2_31_9b]
MNTDKTLIETFGYIKKEENLITVESNIILNTFVLESQHEFPGYHGNIPEKSQPRSLFLITSKDYQFEDIARTTKKIKKVFNHDFNASQGHIYFKSETLSCIRLKYLKSFTFIPELQNLLKDEDIKFSKKRFLESTGLIVINKRFYVSEREEGLYQDLEEESKYYLELPIKLEWEMFKKITLDIKNNVDNINFDAAQGVFYRKCGIVDVVRIYDQDKNVERLTTLRKLYLDEINKKQSTF